MQGRWQACDVSYTCTIILKAGSLVHDVANDVVDVTLACSRRARGHTLQALDLLAAISNFRL